MSNDYVQECGVIDLSELQITGEIAWYELIYPVAAFNEGYNQGFEWEIILDGPWGAVPSSYNIIKYDCENFTPVPPPAEIVIFNNNQFTSRAYGYIKKCVNNPPQIGEIPEVFSNPLYPP